MQNEKEAGHSSRYRYIAAEIARRVATGMLPVGTRLHSRSAVASYFSVSPETARKAVGLLAELGIVETRQGSGTVVVSRGRAEQYLRQFSELNRLCESRDRLRESITRQQAELARQNELLTELEQEANSLIRSYVLFPYFITVAADCPYCGETLGELKLWEKTGATVIAVEHSGQLLVSPGPDVRIEAGDVLVYVAEENRRGDLERFLSHKAQVSAR